MGAFIAVPVMNAIQPTATTFISLVPHKRNRPRSPLLCKSELRLRNGVTEKVADRVESRKAEDQKLQNSGRRPLAHFFEVYAEGCDSRPPHSMQNLLKLRASALQRGQETSGMTVRPAFSMASSSGAD